MQCHSIITLLLKWNISLRMFLLFFSVELMWKCGLRGVSGTAVSTKLPSYWRLMNKFVRGTSPLCAASPLSMVWFMDTQQCMSYNFKGVCFSSWRWNFKCRDEWHLVDFYLWFCRDLVFICAHVFLKFMHIYIYIYAYVCHFVNFASYLNTCLRKSAAAAVFSLTSQIHHL